MIIQCENCKRNYRLEDSRIKPPGSSVRCSKCGHIFFVSKAKDPSEADKPGMSLETPLFEDLREEIVTKDTSSDHSEKEESGSYEATQTELNIQSSTEEIESDLVDLPTENDQSLEELIEIEVGETNKAALQSKKTEDADRVEKKPTAPHVGDISIDQGPEDSIPEPPELFEAEESEETIEETILVENDSRIETKLEKENVQELEIENFENPVLDKDAANAADTDEENLGEQHILEEPNIMETSRPSPETTLHKSRAGIFARIIYTLITILALCVIFIASLVILINAEILPKGTMLGLTNFVESIVPIELNNTEVQEVIITEHRGRWMNTINGPIYIVSGLITNGSQAPIHYVRLKSEYIAAEKIQFEDIFYAGNTFADNELKSSPIQKILSKLKQKNGDIDVNNSSKLAGLNYNIQPGESIPFFTVFPADGRVLGLKYNLQILDYETSSSK